MSLCSMAIVLLVKGFSEVVNPSTEHSSIWITHMTVQDMPRPPPTPTPGRISADMYRVSVVSLMVGQNVH